MQSPKILVSVCPVPNNRRNNRRKEEWKGEREGKKERGRGKREEGR